MPDTQCPRPHAFALFRQNLDEEESVSSCVTSFGSVHDGFSSRPLNRVHSLQSDGSDRMRELHSSLHAMGEREERLRGANNDWVETMAPAIAQPVAPPISSNGNFAKAARLAEVAHDLTQIQQMRLRHGGKIPSSHSAPRVEPPRRGNTGAAVRGSVFPASTGMEHIAPTINPLPQASQLPPTADLMPNFEGQSMPSAIGVMPCPRCIAPAFRLQTCYSPRSRRGVPPLAIGAGGTVCQVQPGCQMHPGCGHLQPFCHMSQHPAMMGGTSSVVYMPGSASGMTAMAFAPMMDDGRRATRF